MSTSQLIKRNNAGKKWYTEFYHRLPIVKSKKATLVLVWSILMSTYEVFLFRVALLFLSVLNRHPSTMIMSKGSNDFYSFAFLAYPVGGLIADVCYGRYRTISYGIYLAFSSYILIAIGCILWYVNEIMCQVFLYVGLLVYVLSLAGFRSNIILFNIDQLIGASADKLSTVIYWHNFGRGLSYTCAFFIELWIHSRTQLAITHLTIAGFAIATIVITQNILKHWLDITPQITNPIKLIAKVLNYARKNKYPRSRSALTYWENEVPSRLDLGKEKYGGPFSEEQVEDVKTVLRLIPMLVCLAGMIIAWEISFNLLIQIEPSYGHFEDIDTFLLSGGLLGLISTALIFLHQFLMNPCFYKYIHSMLFRIRFGLVIASVSSLSYLILYIVWYYQDRFAKDSCTFASISNSTTDALVTGNYWILVPIVIHSFSFFIIYTSSMEFIIAQSPMNMRGFMIGLWFTTYGTCLLLNNYFYVPFTYLKSAPLGCDFYYFLAKSIVVVFVLVIFLVLAKHYKLRIRENVVNIHEIVEDHYERYMQEEDMNEQDNLYGSISSN